MVHYGVCKFYMSVFIELKKLLISLTHGCFPVVLYIP
jgi:hypothetical protein